MKRTILSVILGIILAAAVIIIFLDRPPDHFLVPKPELFEKGNGRFLINPETSVLVSPEAAEEYFFNTLFLSTLREVSGHPLPVRMFSIGLDTSNSIRMVLNRDKTSLGEEGYELTADSNGISIEAQALPGLFYGTRSLFQLLPPATAQKTNGFPQCRIVDKPRFKWRGMHLDTCRHFFPVSFIKKYLDIMAQYKLNTFHWHLTEDQGWRIEIRKYPKLTEVGAWRKETLAGHYRDQPHQYDNTPHGGFYRQDEIREIVQYAKERFITIVPEIEMPGHSVAALAAYPELSCTGGPFEVATKWGIFEDVYCAGNEQVFEFMENVLSEVIELFPGNYIHIGGDECPKVRWDNCPKCQKRIRDEGLEDSRELQSYFIKRIEKFLISKGRRLVGWDEILEGGLAPQATVMSWRGMIGGIEAANAGHDVVMSPTTHCYFDYYQGKQNEPLAIGGYLPLKKVYKFEPVPKDINPDKKDHILGGQANLWTEYIKTPKHAEYMLLPRMCALSEVLWTPQKQKNFKDFSKRMQPHYNRMTLSGINFRQPD